MAYGPWPMAASLKEEFSYSHKAAKGQKPIANSH
jgi:hypothetical protein